MKAYTQNNDFQGSAAADGDSLRLITDFLELDRSRFELIGLSIHGTDGNSVALLCVDKEKPRSPKEHIISLKLNKKQSRKVLNECLKDLHVVLHKAGDAKYLNNELVQNEENMFSKYHGEQGQDS